MSSKKYIIFSALFVILYIISPKYVYAEENKAINDDLSISSITITPSNLAVDQDCIITVTAVNTGTSTLWSSSGIMSIYFIYPDFISKETIYPSVNTGNVLKPTEKIYYIFKGKFIARGIKKLSFKIDESDQLDEFNESNNIMTNEIEIHPPEDLDLEVNAISLSNTKPVVDENLSITISIKNTGKISLVDDKGFLTEDKVTDSVSEKEIKYFFEDFSLSSVKYDNYPANDKPLDPGGIINYVYQGSFNKAGVKNLSFQANIKNRLKELNISNDMKIATVTVFMDEDARDDFNIDNISINYASSTTVIIKWTTAKSTLGKIEYKRSEFTSFTDEINNSASEMQEAILNDLSPGKSYSFKITATYGTVTKTNENKFFMPSTNNVLVLAGPTAVVNNELKKVVISWTTNFLSTSYVFYNNGGTDYLNNGSDILIANHEIIIDKLKEDNYFYYIKSTGKSGAIYQSKPASFSTIVSENKINNSANISINTSDVISTKPISITNADLYKNLKGKIILKIESKGEAYYVNPISQDMYSLGRPDDAFRVMREQGVGIIDSNLEKLPIGIMSMTGIDTDSDGLSDIFEDAIGTDKYKKDTDNDGFNDLRELNSGYSPSEKNKQPNIDNLFAARQKGKIFLQVEGKGEAWLVNPSDAKRYFLGRPGDAFNVMRKLGLGISNKNFDSLIQ